ncbi:MAG TPA: cytochrome c biogenesis protein CcsA [Candidatus Acidoferrales bacterium]
MTSTLGYGTLALYGTSLACYVWHLYSDQRWTGRLATATLAAGLAVHWLALLERARELDSVPYQDLYGSMSLFAWLLGLTYLGVEAFHRQRSVGPFVLPVVMGLMVVATLLAPAEIPPPPEKAHGVLFALHVTLSILGYSAFALAFVMSLIYLAQNRLLRDRKLDNVFWKFPALELLERMSRSSVIVGMASMVVGTVLGFVWAHRIQGAAWNADAKEVVTIAILALYGIYLWLGRTTTWRGARAAVVCVANFVIVVFSYTIVNLYLSKYHRFF